MGTKLWGQNCGDKIVGTKFDFTMRKNKISGNVEFVSVHDLKI